MHGQYLAVNNGGQTEIVKDIAAVPPHIGTAKLADALVVKAINLGNLPTFMIAPNQSHPIGVAHLEGQQQQKGFDTVESAVHKIA